MLPSNVQQIYIVGETAYIHSLEEASVNAFPACLHTRIVYMTYSTYADYSVNDKALQKELNYRRNHFALQWLAKALRHNPLGFLRELLNRILGRLIPS